MQSVIASPSKAVKPSKFDRTRSERNWCNGCRGKVNAQASM